MRVLHLKFGVTTRMRQQPHRNRAGLTWMHSIVILNEIQILFKSLDRGYMNVRAKLQSGRISDD
jgi:hypothetical protein